MGRVSLKKQKSREKTKIREKRLKQRKGAEGGNLTYKNMSNAIQLLQSQQAREMQRGFNRPTSINDLKAQVKPKLKSSKLERPKVDPNAIRKRLENENAKKRDKIDTERKRKEELMRKRYENDGGAHQRRILANQKATVKIKIDGGGDRSKEKAAPTSKRLRDEYDADKMTRDLKAKKDRKEKDSRKRKSDSALPSSKSSKSKIVEKPKSRPKPKRPDALALLQQLETGGRSDSPKMSKQEQPSSSKISKSSKSSSSYSSSSSKSSRAPEPDPAYITWGMDSQEKSWYLDNLLKVEKYKEKVTKCQELDKPIPTMEDFFGPRGNAMINRIKARKKDAKKKQKQALAQKKEKLKKKSAPVSAPPAPPSKPKPLNPYLKKEVNSGKQIRKAAPPPEPEIKNEKTNRKEIKERKNATTTGAPCAPAGAQSCSPTRWLSS